MDSIRTVIYTNSLKLVAIVKERMTDGKIVYKGWHTTTDLHYIVSVNDTAAVPNRLSECRAAFYHPCLSDSVVARLNRTIDRITNGTTQVGDVGYLMTKGSEIICDGQGVEVNAKDYWENNPPLVDLTKAVS